MSEIQGQLSPGERELLTSALTGASKKPERVLEVGTWLGGGSTLHLLRALQQNGAGHLWGIEYDRSIYDQMIANIRAAIPEALDRFTPLFGRSEEVIPQWLSSLPPGATIDFAFLDGGDHPNEQVAEFDLLDPVMPVGAELMAHDALMRKGRWFVPYLRALDHWQTEMLTLSEVGLLRAKKIASQPSGASREAASRVLAKVRRGFTETVARILPPALRRIIARLLPARVMKRLMHGPGK
jgi:predicted O-methyltransferase YrrM